jgi:vacuolar iron transporter family protein
MGFPYREVHLSGRAAWLRAAVLGANDGLISTASLMVGVAAADSSRNAIMVAGIAGMTAGALSMAAGEYVSVASQRDAEQADLERERRELEHTPEAELDELTAIYRRRGLNDDLARQVAEELSQGDRLVVHARDELGIEVGALANPAQASIVSALSFIVGAIVPVLVMAIAGNGWRIATTMSVTVVGLVVLGVAGARLGGAPRRRAGVRVAVAGAIALVVSLLIGHVTGTAL